MREKERLKDKREGEKVQTFSSRSKEYRISINSNLNFRFIYLSFGEQICQAKWNNVFVIKF